jgi:taspase (threonine aspartase 1)
VLFSRPVLIESTSMQHYAFQDFSSPTSVKNSTPRERLRHIRQEVINSFRKSPKADHNITSSSTEQDSTSSVDSTLPIAPFSSPSTSLDNRQPSIMDGPHDRLFGRGQRTQTQNPINVSAIFVHAGAGYHSTTNEHIHLSACNE